MTGFRETVPISAHIGSNEKIDLNILTSQGLRSLAAPDPMTLKKKGSGETQYKKKVQTGMQSVIYSFRNITALSIIDIINQLLAMWRHVLLY